MVEPVKLSTLYDPQGKWTGLGPEPTGVSAPEGQEAYFTPGQKIEPPKTIPLHSMQWSDMVRFGYDPHTRTYPGEGTYRPGTVSYRDIPTPETPAPIQQVQNLIPGAATAAPVNQKTLQQLAQEKANAQLTANLFPTFNQPAVAPTTPAVAPTTPAVAPTTPAVAPQPTMAQPTMAQPTMAQPAIDPGDAERYRQGIFGARPVDKYGLDPFNPFFYLPGRSIKFGPGGPPPPPGWTGEEGPRLDIPGGPPLVNDPNDPTKDYEQFGPMGMPFDPARGEYVEDWYDTSKYAGGGEVLDRPMFANGGPVDPQEAMAPDVLATSSTGEPEVKQSDLDAMSSQEYTDKEIEVYQTIQDKMDNATGVEDIMDAIRGDEKSVKERKAELAEIVGPGDAKKTPESSLTIAQFGLKEIEKFNEGMAKGEMAPEGIETLPPGTEALAADQGALMGGEQMQQVPGMMQPPPQSPPQMAAEGGMIPGYANGGIINALPHYANGGSTSFYQDDMTWGERGREIGTLTQELENLKKSITPKITAGVGRPGFDTRVGQRLGYEGAIPRGYGARFFEPSWLRGSTRDYWGTKKDIGGFEKSEAEKKIDTSDYDPRSFLVGDTGGKSLLEMAETPITVSLEDIKVAKSRDYKEGLRLEALRAQQIENARTQQTEADKERKIEIRKRLKELDPGSEDTRVKRALEKEDPDTKIPKGTIDDAIGNEISIQERNKKFDEYLLKQGEKGLGNIQTEEDKIKELASRNERILEDVGLGPDEDYNNFSMSMILFDLGRRIATNTDPNLLINILESSEKPAQMLMALATKNMDDKKELKKAAVSAAFTEYQGRKTTKMKDYEYLKSEGWSDTEAFNKIWPDSVTKWEPKFISDLVGDRINSHFTLHTNDDFIKKKYSKVKGGIEAQRKAAMTDHEKFRNHTVGSAISMVERVKTGLNLTGVKEGQGLVPSETITRNTFTRDQGILAIKDQDFFKEQITTGNIPADQVDQKAGEVFDSMVTIDGGLPEAQRLENEGTIKPGVTWIKWKDKDGRWKIGQYKGIPANAKKE